MAYNIQHKNDNLANYEHAIFNFNERAKLEIKNLKEFIQYAETIRGTFAAQDGKRCDKRFINKINNEKFRFVIDAQYETLSGDLILYFNNTRTKGKSVYYDFDAGEYREKITENNELTGGQSRNYFRLAKNEQSNAIFDFNLFLADIERLKQRIAHLSGILRNQKATLKRAIRLNNELYGLFYDNEFIRAMIENNY